MIRSFNNSNNHCLCDPAHLETTSSQKECIAPERCTWRPGAAALIRCTRLSRTIGRKTAIPTGGIIAIITWIITRAVTVAVDKIREVCGPVKRIIGPSTSTRPIPIEVKSGFSYCDHVLDYFPLFKVDAPSEFPAAMFSAEVIHCVCPKASIRSNGSLPVQISLLVTGRFIVVEKPSSPIKSSYSQQRHSSLAKV